MTNLVLGPKFLKEVQAHYNSRGEEDAKMCLEKLQLLLTSCVDVTQKVMWLRWWNVKCLVWENFIFQNTEVSNAAVTKWLHKATFWGQVCHDNFLLSPEF